MNYCVIMFAAREPSTEEKRSSQSRTNTAVSENGSVFDPRVFVLGGYTESVVCLHLTSKSAWQLYRGFPSSIIRWNDSII